MIVARVLQYQVQQGQIQITTAVLKRSELLAYDDGGSIGNFTSVENLLNKMLQYSSNTATNLLIEKMGGLSRVTSIANKLGYRATVLRTYLSVDQQQSILPNISTVRDTTKALKDLWLSNDQVARITKLSLQNADIKFGYPGEIAAKIGNNSAVVANIGIVKIGKKYYSIGAAINRADSTQSRRNLSAALSEIVALIAR